MGENEGFVASQLQIQRDNFLRKTEGLPSLRGLLAIGLLRQGRGLSTEPNSRSPNSAISVAAATQQDLSPKQQQQQTSPQQQPQQTSPQQQQQSGEPSTA
jgi:hypothetical protein